MQRRTGRRRPAGVCRRPREGWLAAFPQRAQEVLSARLGITQARVLQNGALDKPRQARARSGVERQALF